MCSDSHKMVLKQCIRGVIVMPISTFSLAGVLIMSIKNIRYG